MCIDIKHAIRNSEIIRRISYNGHGNENKRCQNTCIHIDLQVNVFGIYV